MPNLTNANAALGLAELSGQIGSAISSLTGAATNIPDLTEQLPDALKSIADQLQANFKDIFLKIDKADGSEATTTIEYALWVSVSLSGVDALKDKFPFNIIALEELYFKIWNTNDPAVLNKLNPVNVIA
jgi:hypothetical protein